MIQLLAATVLVQ